MKKILTILTMAFFCNINAQESEVDPNYRTAELDNFVLIAGDIHGSGNTASGSQALGENKWGSYGSGFGFKALEKNNTGSGNSGFGYKVLVLNDNGCYNTASGYKALHKNTGGHNNTAFGSSALKNNETGNNNTAIGAETQTSITNAMNQTVIGYKAIGQADNSVTLGNEKVNAVYMGEDSGATIYAVGLRTASNAILTLSDDDATFADDVTVNGDLTVASDARLKANIASLGTTLAKLLLIDGKTYTLKKNGKQKIGLLAQDIQKVFPELVHKNDDEMLSVNYQGLVPVLINALKEQNDKISRLKRLVEKLIADKY
jgi:hypothetical protein